MVGSSDIGFFDLRPSTVEPWCLLSETLLPKLYFIRPGTLLLSLVQDLCRELGMSGQSRWGPVKSFI